MGQAAFALNVEFQSITCCNCGVPFAAPGFFFENRREDHKNFYCPNGHEQWFPAKSETEKLRDELKAEQARKQAALARLNEAEEAQRKLERKLKRVARGTCPECNRSFANLARHMSCKHGDAPVHRVGAKPLP